jgi:peptidoglycan/LPS O-acetylase OafA/YrhL
LGYQAPLAPDRPRGQNAAEAIAWEPDVGKRLLAGLGVIGLAFAGALVKGIYSRTLDTLGWVGVVIGIGVFVLLIAVALDNRSPNAPADNGSEPPSPPTSQ